MRTLVGCRGCKRQFDASGMAVGSRFRCGCGEVVSVPRIAPKDAAVVRCSSCGAARGDGSLACRYCGSDFTLHERDLGTICPSCFARISDHARYCHHCATPIVPEGRGGSETESLCPACGAGHRLHSRPLGEASLTALECRRCAGLWLADEAFRILTERARAAAVPDPGLAEVPPEARRANPAAAAPGPLYRPCVVCSKRMNRTNFGRRSGVVIDRCKDHGVWFDASELDAVLRFIREGGEALAEASRVEEQKAVASAARFRVEPRTPEGAWRAEHDASGEETGFLPFLLRFLTKNGGFPGR